MKVEAGSRLGPYEVLGLIGAGGMGEVYKARDTRLDRSVALKILPDAISSDPERRARFDREARAVASLAHPNICTLHDVGVQDGAAYFVMELLTGETLADRLLRGPLPVETAIDIGISIGDALASAHRAGLVHRDLKPSNVMLTKTGVKLLDFGLAKLTGHGALPAVAMATVTVPGAMSLTERGTMLGTLPYMAPEQVQGLEVDARTDLWALGCLLYEMVSGTRAFDGANPTSLVGAILERNPDPLVSRRPLTPSALDRLVRQCLAKNPDDRLDTAHDVVNNLRWIRESDLERRAGGRTRTPLLQRVLWLATGVALGVVAALLATRAIGEKTSPTGVGVIRTSLDVQSADGLLVGEPYGWTAGGSRTALAWLPDGRSLVFVGRKVDATQQLYVRSLARTQAQLIPGTDNAISPTVSADGRWVAFWADGVIKKVPLASGPSQVLEAGVDDEPTRLAWSSNSDLFYDSRKGIRQLSSTGSRSLTKVEGTSVSHELPSLLPGDRVLLYTVRQRQWTWGDERVVALDMKSGETKVLLHDATDARYVPSGHLLFLRRGQLLAVPFDPVGLEVRGTPVAVLDDVSQALVSYNANLVTGAGQYAVGATGALAWLPGAPVPYPDASLTKVSRTGQVAPLAAPTRSYSPVVRVAPDGRRLSVVVKGLTKFSLCMYDTERETLTSLTDDGEFGWPIWTPDGRHLLFDALIGGRRSLEWLTTDDSSSTEILTDNLYTPSSWLPNGRGLAMVGGAGNGQRQIQLVLIGEDGKAVLQPPIPSGTPARTAEFSPNGHWLAYEAQNSGDSQVYVQPFPGLGPRLQVSTNGGANPAWNPNGSELFFMAPASGASDFRSRLRLMVVSVRDVPALTLGTPRQLFEFTSGKELTPCGPTRCYDVARDGQHFYSVQTVTAMTAPAVTQISLILNWLDDVNQKVPTETR